MIPEKTKTEFFRVGSIFLTLITAFYPFIATKQKGIFYDYPVSIIEGISWIIVVICAYLIAYYHGKQY